MTVLESKRQNSYSVWRLAAPNFNLARSGIIMMKAGLNTNLTKSVNLKRKSFKRHVLPYWDLYLLLLIPLVYVIIFSYIPMAGIQLAFKDFDFTKGIFGSEWVGLKYFEKFINSYQFERVFGNTFLLSFYSLVASFPIPIIMALGLNAVLHSKYKKFVQTVTYLPHFISTVVIVGIMMQVFNPLFGLYGIVYQSIFGIVPKDLFGSPDAFPHLYVWSGIWQNAGWSTIIYISALSSVDSELHEAAQIDGASRFQRIRYIDFPSILPTAVILLIMNTGSLMSVGFEKAFLMQTDLNLSASEIISTYVYKVGLVTGGGDFSYGTTIGLFNSVINFALLVIVNAISKKVSSVSLW